MSAPKIVDEQAELLPLLEGAEPDAYVVISLKALSTQLQLAAGQAERRDRGELRRGRLTYYLIRQLVELGFVVDKAHDRQEPE